MVNSLRVLVVVAMAGAGDATASRADKTTIRLNTGAQMPYINCGGTSQAVRAGNHYSNYSEFLRQGGRGLDTALGYTDQINEQIAAAIKDHPEIPRADIFVTTKLPCAATSRKPEMACAHAQDCMERNNALLQLPWTDLTLMHEPCRSTETADGTELTILRWLQLEAGLAAGLTKAIGVSNFDSALLEAMLADPRVKIVPAVNQCDHAVANTNNTRGGGDDATVQFCQSHGIAYSAYSPLQGLWSNSSVLDIPEVIAIGKAHKVSAAQVAFRWLIQQNISAVTAAHKPEYITEDLDVFSFELTSAEMATLSALSPPSPSPSTCLQGTTYLHGKNFENGKDVGEMIGTTASDCAAACCANPRCGHFVFTMYQPGGAYQGQKMCWLKSAKAGKYLGGRPNCTSGMVPAGPAPVPPPPSKYWVPTLNFVKTIAFDPHGNLRDPSAAVQDPVTKRWHFWVDHMNGSTKPGWDAYLYHYSAPEILGPWESHGLALPHSSDPKAWDYSGTFSSSAIYSDEEKLWYLFYSASGANQSSMQTCAQAVASAKSPDGPWQRLFPAVATPTSDPASNWTGGWNARRLDSGRAMVVGGQKGYWTKGVSSFNTATEGLYLPHSPTSWTPPYSEAPNNPLFPPQPGWDPDGYENCEFFRGPLGVDELHIWCAFHGKVFGKPGMPQGPAPHFVIDLKTDPHALNWTYAGALNWQNKSDDGPAPGGECVTR